MSPEEHYARAEHILADTVMVRGQLPHQGQWFEHLLARAQVHATLALFSPGVSIEVQASRPDDEVLDDEVLAGPWQSLNDIPASVRKVKASNGYTWVRISGGEGWMGCDSSMGVCRAGHPEVSPFISAKEEEL